MSEVHALVSDALKAGIPMDEIISDFAQNGSEEEKDWAHRWASTAARPSYVAGAMAQEPKKESVIDKLGQHYEESSKGQLAAEGVGILAAGKGLQLAGRAGNQIVDRWVQNKFPTMSERAYSEQVAKQGMSAAMSPQEFAQLSPLEQERIYTEQAKQAELNSRIRHREHQIALQEAKNAGQPALTAQAAITGVPSTTQSFAGSEPKANYSLTESAYGQQKTNAPTGVPSPIPAPAGQAAAVQPPPMSELESIRLEQEKVKLEAARAKAARDQELHEKKIADMEARAAKQDTQKLSNLQGQSSAEVDMQKSSVRAEQGKSVDAVIKSNVKKYPPVKTETPVVGAAEPSTTTSTKEPVVATPEAVAKAESTAKWRGGSEGSALQLFGASKKTIEPKHLATLEVFKDFVGGELAPSTGGTIKEMPKFAEFVKKHTGEDFLPNAEGKYPRLTTEQQVKINSGVQSELEDAVKGGKLSTLSKGAMAAVALLGLTGAVQAAQKGDFGPLREAGFDIGGPIAAGKLGLGLLSKAGGLGFSALTHAGGLNTNEERELAIRRQQFEKESKKLGSPYRSVPPPR